MLLLGEPVSDNLVERLLRELGRVDGPAWHSGERRPPTHCRVGGVADWWLGQQVDAACPNGIHDGPVLPLHQNLDRRRFGASLKKIAVLGPARGKDLPLDVDERLDERVGAASVLRLDVVRHALEVDVGVVPGQHLRPALPTIDDATGRP